MWDSVGLSGGATVGRGRAMTNSASVRRGGRRAARDDGKVRVPGREEPSDVDRLIHEPMRLGIMSALVVNDSLSFSDLKGVLSATDGNLSVHARRLEEAGYVACSKGFEGRMPRTEYKLTPTGRKALDCYLDHMEALIKATRTA